MQKNEIVKVKIEDIGVGGEGIGKVEGYTLFIKDAIIGDVVEAKVMKAKKNYGYARLMNVLTPSKDRVEEPVCLSRPNILIVRIFRRRLSDPGDEVSGTACI